MGRIDLRCGYGRRTSSSLSFNVEFKVQGFDALAASTTETAFRQGVRFGIIQAKFSKFTGGVAVW